MPKLTLTFRLPADTMRQVNSFVSFYHYKNTSEFYSLVLTECASYQLGGYRECVPGKIRLFADTIPQACRVNPLVYRIIRDRCAPAIGNTASVWCAVNIQDWIKEYRNRLKEDMHGPRSNIGMPARSKEHRQIAAECLKDLFILDNGFEKVRE